MPADIDLRAILIVDCGVEHTRVSLVDIVGENEYRLVSQREVDTTAEPPIADVTAGVYSAIVELERSTGRQLLEGDRLRFPQSRDGHGLDALIATCSAGGGLPVLVLAVTVDISAESAVRAVEGTYATPFRVVTMDEVLRDSPLAGDSVSPEREPWWRLVETLPPGAVVIVGGIDGGNPTPLHTLACALAEALPPRAARLEEEVARVPLPVIYAGNRRAQEVVRQCLADWVDLRVLDNVRPTLREEQLGPVRQELTRLYEEQVLQRVPGYEGLASWSQGPVQLPYAGLQLSARFLAEHHRRQVLAVDLGSGSVTAVWAAPGRCARVVLGNFGLGYGIARVLARRGAAGIRRWLPFPMSEEEIRNWVLNQALRPRTVPETLRDLLLRQAVAREALAEAAGRLRAQMPDGYEMAVGSGGGLARACRPAQAALMMLDALPSTEESPAGLLDLYLDRSVLLPSIGALATLNPDAAACVLLKDGLFHLGPCLIPLGKGKPGSPALAVTIEYGDGARQEAQVSWGQIVCLPFERDEEVHLTVKPARGARLSNGRPGQQLTTHGGETIRGGCLGLIVDARGRPLPLPSADGVREECLRRWLVESGAFTAMEMESLVPAPPPQERPDTADTPPGEAAGPAGAEGLP